MTTTTPLANHLLVATPGMLDPNFTHSVIYLCEHHENGSSGMIINQPLAVSFSMIFEQLHIQTTSQAMLDKKLLFGGPLQPERGFVIHKQDGKWRASLKLSDDVTVTTSNDIIRAMAVGEGPTDVLITLGFMAWAPKQLEIELKQNTWLVCPFSKELLYDIPFEKRWHQAGGLLGVDMNQLSSASGHA